MIDNDVSFKNLMNIMSVADRKQHQFYARRIVLSWRILLKSLHETSLGKVMSKMDFASLFANRLTRDHINFTFSDSASQANVTDKLNLNP